MSINLHDIDNLFKHPIEEHTEIPSSAVWDNINQKLDEKKIINLKRKYTNLIRMTAILMILLVCSVVYYYGFNKPSIQSNFTHVTYDPKELNKTTAPGPQMVLGNNEVQHFNDKKDPAKTTSSTIIASNESLNEGKNISSSAKQPQLKETNAVVEKIKIITPINIISSATKEKRKEENIFKDAYSTHYDVVTLQNLNNNLFTEKIKEETKKQSLELFYKNYSAHQKILLDISKILPSPVRTNPLKFTPFIPVLTQGNTLNRNKVSPLKKISVTIYASPEMAYNRLDDDKIEEVRALAGNRPPDDRHKIKKEEQRTTSFSSGILVDYRFSRQWSIQSGISLNQKLSETAPKPVFAELANDGLIKFRNNCVFGSSYILPKSGRTINIGDSAMAEATRNKLFYVGIPINISYHISKDKFSINPNVGTTLNFLVDQVVKTSLTDSIGSEKQESKIINGLKPTYISAHIGIDFSYLLTNKLSLTVMPTATMALTSVNENSSVRSYPNSFGIRVGLKIHL